MRLFAMRGNLAVQFVQAVGDEAHPAIRTGRGTVVGFGDAAFPVGVAVHSICSTKSAIDISATPILARASATPSLA